MHPSVHSSTIYNSQYMEATAMPTDRWVDKEDVCILIYNAILLIKKEWNNAICSHMDGPRDFHTKWNKSDKDKIIWDHLYVEYKKIIIQMNPFIKQRLSHRYRNQIYGYQKGKRERDKFVIWD